VGETAADTARELAALRAETDRLLEELDGRVRRTLDVPQQVATKRAVVQVVVPVLGGLAALAVLLIWLRNWRRAVRARRARAERQQAEALARELGLPPQALLPPAAAEAERAAAADEPSLLQRTLGALAASGVLALVDYLARRFSAAQWSTIRREVPVAESEPTKQTESPTPASGG
jgi:hypothetical protein